MVVFFPFVANCPPIIGWSCGEYVLLATELSMYAAPPAAADGGGGGEEKLGRGVRSIERSAAVESTPDEEGGCAAETAECTLAMVKLDASKEGSASCSDASAGGRGERWKLGSNWTDSFAEGAATAA
jgi:hypothetical protein